MMERAQMKNMFKAAVGLGLICALFVVFPYVRNEIGVTSANLEADFRGGGSLSGVDTGITEFTVEGCSERAFISMNQQQVARLEIDDGNSIQVIDIDSKKPFAIVLPINSGIITFCDVNGRPVEYWNNPL